MKKHYLFTSLLAAATLSVASVNAQNITTEMANGLSVAGGADGTQHTCSIKPFGIYINYFGNIYVSDYSNHKIKELFQSDTSVHSIAGSATPGFSGDGSDATGAQLNLPAGICTNYAGDTIYFADAHNHAIRKLSLAGSHFNIYTIAGTGGTSGFSGDGGLASAAQFNNPFGICRDLVGNIYIADQGNNRIRKIDHATGNISTIAGGATAGSSGDGGAATAALLNGPTGVFVDTPGNIYIADQGNNTIRKIDLSGNISTVAGTAGSSGSSGDGGVATSAKLNAPTSVFYYAGNIYIADKNNNKIRKVDNAGMISTVAGTGTAGYNGDNMAASSAQLSGPTDIFVNNNGLYIVDAGNFRIRKVALPNAVSGPQNALASTIAPNPSNGQFTITLPSAKGTVSVAINNVVGTTIYASQIANGKLQVDMSAQPAGVYFVHLASGNTTATQKIVVNK